MTSLEPRGARLVRSLVSNCSWAERAATICLCCSCESGGTSSPSEERSAKSRSRFKIAAETAGSRAAIRDQRESKSARGRAVVEAEADEMIRQTASRAARRSSRVSSARKWSSSGPSRCNESFLISSSRRGPEAKERELAGVLFFGGGVCGIFEVDGYQWRKSSSALASQGRRKSRRTRDQSLESSRATWGGWLAGREEEQQQHVLACCCCS